MSETAQETNTAAEGNGYPFSIRLVDLNVLFADGAYQRPLVEQRVNKITSNFDPALVGTIDVSDRGDGTFAIIDGQQRVEALRRLEFRRVYCNVYTGLTPQQESEFFYRKNWERSGIRAFYGLRARAEGGEKQALELFAIARRNGFILSASGNDLELIAAVRACEASYERYGAEALSSALGFIQEHWFGQPKSTSGEIIRGLSRFMAAFGGQFDPPTLSQALQIGPESLLDVARAQAGGSGRSSVGTAVGKAIAVLYNRTAGKEVLDEGAA